MDKRRHLPLVEFEKFYFFIIMFHFMDCFRQTIASGRDMSFHIPHSVMIISNLYDSIIKFLFLKPLEKLNLPSVDSKSGNGPVSYVRFPTRYE
jgi:hypothetical protein